MQLVLAFLNALTLLVAVVHVVDACNRFYTTTALGGILQRINWKNGTTTTIGKWKKNDNPLPDHTIRSMEWNFPQKRMYGLLDAVPTANPPRTMRFVKVNRRKPRRGHINRTNKGETGRDDLVGLAIDANSTVWAHSQNSPQALFTINTSNGIPTQQFETNLPNIIDLAYKGDTDEIYATDGQQIFLINQYNGRVSLFADNLFTNANVRIRGIAFDPVDHIMVLVTNFLSDANTLLIPTMYQLINGAAVNPQETSLTDQVYGGTLQCKRRVFTDAPSALPSSIPSAIPSSNPSLQPSTLPSKQPSSMPSLVPSSMPSLDPSSDPSGDPSTLPSAEPSSQPSVVPSGRPSMAPSLEPSRTPSTRPSLGPSSIPSSMPSQDPSTEPSSWPTQKPSQTPSWGPSSEPSTWPSLAPSQIPSLEPSSKPSQKPSFQPTETPSSEPTQAPTSEPTEAPSLEPSGSPSVQPTSEPSERPSLEPSGIPSFEPTSEPSEKPTREPSDEPSSRPSQQPSRSPMPSREPSSKPTSKPTQQPSRSSRPSSAPM